MQNSLIKFVEWTKIKIKIHLTNRIIYFREKEIWWASLGANIGFEQDGKHSNFERPVLVLKKFNWSVLWILPITSKIKDNKYYYQYEYDQRKYSIILSQLRLISSKRLMRKIRTMPTCDFNQIKELIRNLL